MTGANLQVRRATVEDLPSLIELWQVEQLPWPNLEKRFKEFQVVEAEGRLAGAVGLHLSGLDGLVHSEVFAQPEQADTLREVLWERVRTVAENHGLVRLWTQLNAPFWRTTGLKEPAPELLTKLPQAFANPGPPWSYLQLKDETAPAISIEKEFALFKEAEQEEREKMFRRARVLKLIAGVLGMAVFLLVIVWAFIFMKAQRRFHKP